MRSSRSRSGAHVGNESCVDATSSKAKKVFTLDDLRAQTQGVECRKDAGVVDEIPGAYKDLQTVIDAQTLGDAPLIEVVERLTTMLCVKG